MKLIYTFSVIILTLPTVLFAQGSVYSPLVDLSNAGQGNQVQTFEQYINFLYGMSIAVAALLAVIKIIIAGAKYMLSDVINTKGEALSDIQGAILGLLLILSAVIILELINPQLTDREINFPQLDPSTRGDLKSRAVETVGGGQTKEEVSTELNAGLSECTRKEQKPSQGGSMSANVINTSACDDPAAEMAIFEKNCREKNGVFNKAKTIANQASCEIPIGGSTEFSINSYSDRYPILLKEGYLIKQGSVWAYDYVKQCKSLFPDSDNLSSCKESVENALFGSCYIRGGFTCSIGWCNHNAGEKTTVSNGGITLPACKLPSKRFSESEVKAKFDEISTDEQRLFYDEEGYKRACKALGGISKDIGLNWIDENRRCVTGY
jgi:hypothetical protein